MFSSINVACISVLGLRRLVVEAARISVSSIMWISVLGLRRLVFKVARISVQVSNRHSRSRGLMFGIAQISV